MLRGGLIKLQASASGILSRSVKNKQSFFKYLIAVDLQRDVPIRTYSETSRAVEPYPDLQSPHSNTEISNLPFAGQSSLAISEEFQVGLEQRLKSSNFKSLAYKQDEFETVMNKLENPFNLFYLFEKYSTEFNHFNLLKFTNKMVAFKKSYSDFFIPDSIKTSYTKLLVKHAATYESADCFTLFKMLIKLGFNLDDFALKACMQIFKYHVNELDLSQLIIVKYKLERSKPKDSNWSNEYVSSLEKALGLAANLKIEELTDSTEAVRLVTNFKDDISPNNFEKLIAYINIRFKTKFGSLELPEVLDLFKLMAHKNQVHLKLAEKAVNLLIRPSSTSTQTVLKKLKRRYNTAQDPEIKSNVIDEFSRYLLNLKIYKLEFMDYACGSQLAYLKWCNLGSENSNKVCEMIKTLLKSLTFFQHKRTDLLDFLNDELITSQPDFPIRELVVYSGFVKFNLNRVDYEKLLAGFKCENDVDEFELIEALCWNRKIELARARLEQLVSPENLEYEQKLFLKNVFGVNYMRMDETAPSKSKLIQAFENVANDLDADRFELLPNNHSNENLYHWIDYVILDRKINKKYYLIFCRKDEEFRNSIDETACLTFKKESALKCIKSDELDKGIGQLCVLSLKRMQHFTDLKLKEYILSKINDSI